MPKIENNEEIVKPRRRVFEVAVSFNGLDKGAVFTQDPDDTAWADYFVGTGYLIDRSDQEAPDVRSEKGKG